MRHAAAQRLFLSALFAAAAGCHGHEGAPNSAPPTKSAPKPVPVAWLVPPDGDRVRWLDGLAAESDPAARELLRVHLWDEDPFVSEHAMDLLSEACDAMTLLDRWILLHPDADRRSDETQKELTDLISTLPVDLQRQVVERALVNHWRDEYFGLNLGQLEIGLNLTVDPEFPGDWTKTGQENCGGRPLLAHDRVSLTRPKTTSPYSRDLGAPAYWSRIPSDPFDDTPVPGAWALQLHLKASAAIAHQGSWYVADGVGFLVRGSMATGETLWRCPIPIPPSAELRVLDDSLHVRFRVGRNARLLLEFSCAEGLLLRATVLPDEVAAPLARFGNGDVLVCEQTEASWAICRKSGSLTVWSLPLISPVDAVFVQDDDIFIASRFGQSAGLARIKAIDGSEVWARCLRGPSWGLRFVGIVDNRLWIFDRQSWIAIVDAGNGALEAQAMWCEDRFSFPVTNLALDSASSRFLLDPSNGFIYGIAPEALFNLCLLPSPDRKMLTFGEALGSEVFVGALDVDLSASGGDRKDLFHQFANRFEHWKFGSAPPEPGQKVWKDYAEALVAKARRAGLESVELADALSTVSEKLQNANAYVPGGAWRIRYEGEEAWAIVCNSGYHGGNQGPQNIAIWAVSVKTGKILGFESCP